MKKHNSFSQSGFTLVELMITIVIAAIILTLAVPSFRSMLQNNRAYTQANSIHMALVFARSEAVKMGKTISLCPANADQTACANITDWSDGWVAADLEGGGFNILRQWDALKGDPSLTGPGTAVEFSSTGQANMALFTLTLPECTGNNKYAINVEATGRSAASKVACP